MRIIDVSLPIHKGMLTYPGDPPFRSEVFKKFPPSLVSYLHMGSHTGTHMDAPQHSVRSKLGIDRADLSKCMGPCRVLDLSHVTKAIRTDDLRRFKIKKGERILAKTANSKKDFRKFRDDYIFLSAEAARYLAQRSIVLFGIDYLSVKQRGSSDNRPHTTLLQKKIVIVEGLNLSRVRPGKYFFVGLPLRIVSGDGSPIRAVLIE